MVSRSQNEKTDLSSAVEGESIHHLDGHGTIVEEEEEEEEEQGSSNESTDRDDAILRAQGHDATMPRSFSALSALGFGFSITNSWIAYMGNFGQNLIYGGPQVVVFGVLVAAVVQWVVTLGLSELASAFPSSGGQYHFVYIISTRKTRRFAAFVTGWLSVLAWWVVCCSGVSLPAVAIFGMVEFWIEDFQATSWMIYCSYLGVVAVSIAPLFLCPRLIPKIVQFTLYLSVLGFFVNFIVVVAMKKHTQPLSFITRSGLGTSGWNQGTAWVLGVVNAMYVFAGTDGAIHIAEEMQKPGVRLPQVMNLTMAIGFSTVFTSMLTVMIAMSDMDAVLASALPSAEVLYQATGNKAVATFLTCWIILVQMMAVTPQWITCGRMAWAFARHNGTPYSKYFSHIDKSKDFPVRTTVAAMVFVCIYGLLYLASTTAYNSIVTGAVFCLNTTYALPQAIVAIRGRQKTLPKRPLNLGKWGYICNIFAPLWIVVLGVLVCLPPALPVQVSTMNYTSVILVGLFAMVIMFWFTIGGNFEGPRIDWEALYDNSAIEKHS